MLFIVYISGLMCSNITQSEKIQIADDVVAEQGTPDELLQKDGIFKRMSDLQLAGQSWTV